MNICLSENCKKEFKPSRNCEGKYCCNACQKYHQRPIFDDLKTNRARKIRIIEERGYRCECCGVSEWLGELIILEMDHIDGNSEENTRKNLRLLCPNCHSQTPTFKNKNKGNGRHSRRVRYAAGKSF